MMLAQCSEEEENLAESSASLSTKEATVEAHLGIALPSLPLPPGFFQRPGLKLANFQKL